MKMPGRLSMRLMPSSSAMSTPSTATRSRRCTWPLSNQRPAAMCPRTASSRPVDAANTGRVRSEIVVGSMIGTVRMPPGLGMSATAPDATTPFNRSSRSSTSQGSTPAVPRRAASPPCWLPPEPDRGCTVTCVAASSLNRSTIWLPAVREIPSVATSDAMPSTVPSVVSAVRAGRANTPARLSSTRSRTRNRDRVADFGTGAARSPAEWRRRSLTCAPRDDRRPSAGAAGRGRRRRRRG